MITIYIILGLILLIVGFRVIMIITAMMEKQYLRHELVPVMVESPVPASPYFTVMKELAAELKFIHCGDFYTEKGKSIVKGNMSTWLSPDHCMLCMINDGKFAGMRTRKTRLITRLTSHSLLETADEAGLVDITDFIKLKLRLNGDLFELNSLHQSRLVLPEMVPLPFSKQNILDQIEAIELERGKRLVDLGWAKFADWNQETIRYTFSGAMKLTAKSSAGARPDLKQQSERINLPRPGDAKFQKRRIDTPPALPKN